MKFVFNEDSSNLNGNELASDREMTIHIFINGYDLHLYRRGYCEWILFTGIRAMLHVNLTYDESQSNFEWIDCIEYS